MIPIQNQFCALRHMGLRVELLSLHITLLSVSPHVHAHVHVVAHHESNRKSKLAFGFGRRLELALQSWLRPLHLEGEQFLHHPSHLPQLALEVLVHALIGSASSLRRRG